MGKHLGFATPPLLDRMGGTRGEGDEGMRSGRQEIKLVLMDPGIGVMGVAQIMHGVDQGLAVPTQLIDELHKILGGDGVESEVDVEDVELVVVFGDPSGFEHQRRPPTAGNFPVVRRYRIGQAHNRFDAIGV